MRVFNKKEGNKQDNDDDSQYDDSSEKVGCWWIFLFPTVPIDRYLVVFYVTSPDDNILLCSDAIAICL